MPLPRFVLVSFPSLIRKCVAPTGRFRWGRSMKIGLINWKHSTGNPGTSPLDPCCKAFTRILGNATSADGVRRINTSSFFMLQRTFSSLHFHCVCKRFICLICLAGDTVKHAGRGFREPKQTWRYHSNKTSGVRNGKKQQVRGFGNATANFPKLFSCTLTCQNLSEGYWANSAAYGENSLSFQKKVIPSSFSLHEVL